MIHLEHDKGMYGINISKNKKVYNNKMVKRRYGKKRSFRRLYKRYRKHKKFLFRRRPRFARRYKKGVKVGMKQERFTHTILFHSVFASPNVISANQQDKDLAEVQAGMYNVQTGTDKDVIALNALNGAMQLSEHHYGTQIGPCIVDLSKDTVHYQAIIKTLAAKHQIAAQPLQLADPKWQQVNSPKNISITGIKVKNQTRSDRMKPYIPVTLVQQRDEITGQFFTFGGGKMYVKARKLVENNRFIGFWPTILIIGNVLDIKVKIYYKIEKMRPLAASLDQYAAAQVGISRPSDQELEMIRSIKEFSGLSASSQLAAPNALNQYTQSQLAMEIEKDKAKQARPS